MPPSASLPLRGCSSDTWLFVTNCSFTPQRVIDKSLSITLCGAVRYPEEKLFPSVSPELSTESGPAKGLSEHQWTKSNGTGQALTIWDKSLDGKHTPSSYREICSWDDKGQVMASPTVMQDHGWMGHCSERLCMTFFYAFNDDLIKKELDFFSESSLGATALSPPAQEETCPPFTMLPFAPWALGLNMFYSFTLTSYVIFLKSLFKASVNSLCKF